MRNRRNKNHRRNAEGICIRCGLLSPTSVEECVQAEIPDAEPPLMDDQEGGFFGDYKTLHDDEATR